MRQGSGSQESTCTFSHSINGVTVETVSDVQETAAFLNRTGMSYEYARTAGNSLYRLAGADGKRNSESIAPGGALQPWNKSGNTKTVFDCGFLPPSGVFSMPGSLPGGRHRFVLTLNNDLRKRCIIMDSTRAALTSAQTNYVHCTIEEVRFHMCHLVPDAPVPIPRNVVLSIHPLTVVKNGLSASSGSSTHTLSVPPSTDRAFRRRESYDCRQHPRCGGQPRPVRAVALSSTGSVCGPDATKHRVPVDQQEWRPIGML